MIRRSVCWFSIAVCMFLAQTVSAATDIPSMSSTAASDAVVLGIGVDTSVVDAAWTKHIQARMDFTVGFSPEFGIRIPLTVCANQNRDAVVLFDFGLFLDYHPWGEGPFVSVSLVQIGILAGRDRPMDSVFFLNEVLLGWTWHVYKGLYLEPALVVRDPSGVFEDEYDAVRAQLPGMRPFRFSLTVGWDFLSIPDKV